MCKVVGELYDAVEAMVKGRLTGSGVLGTLVLCESLLSFLPTRNSTNQPSRLLKEYNVVPLGTLRTRRRIDLSAYTLVRNGYLYIHYQCMEHICVLLLSLPFSSSSACATAKQGSPCIKVGSARVARIIIVQFKHDLLELGVVTDMSHFDRAR